MHRGLVFLGGLICGLAVAAGSFGAHGLKAVLEATGRADNWETAVRYGLAHGLAILFTTLAAALPEAAAARRLLVAAGASFAAGVAIFSGCLGVLAVTGVRVLGAIVPIGGVLFLVGWALVCAAALRLGPCSTRSGVR
ncbi:MAG: hypothetical protein RLZZ111_1283 [Planctomycetota bacterium]|jgi:uncharacterized membrane protein YgdD (TMEM256/DUF423 family)